MRTDNNIHKFNSSWTNALYLLFFEADYLPDNNQTDQPLVFGFFEKIIFNGFKIGAKIMIEILCSIDKKETVE